MITVVQIKYLGNMGINRMIELPVGETIFLQSETRQDNQRYPVKVIGYIPNKTLLVSMPLVKGEVRKVDLKEVFSAKMMINNSAYGFTTKVQFVCRQPFDYLHLDYPLDCSSIEVRKNQRVKSQLIVSILNRDENPEGENKTVAASDISISGLRLLATETIGKVGDALIISARVRVAGMNEFLLLSGVIRNTFNQDGEGDQVLFGYGVEFYDLENKTSLILQNYIFEQIINGRAS